MLTIMQDLDTLCRNARKEMFKRLPEQCVEFLLLNGV